MTRRIASDAPKFTSLPKAASGPTSSKASPWQADTNDMEGTVWFLRRSSHSNGRLIFEVDAELSSRLRLAAHASEQTPETLATELLARGLEQEAQRSQVQSILETLTPREQEVTWLTVRGYTNRQIAEALVLSPETVKTHVRHILEKLGLRSKGDLRLLLLDLGIRWWEEIPSE
jgi:RNA polymerase sigma factor (sigma-70 family)